MDDHFKSPPPYSASQAPPTTALEKHVSSIIPQNAVTPAARPSVFPQSFGMYRASGSHSDMRIALHAEGPQTLFYISTHSGFSSQPNVVLHSTASQRSPPLATVDFPRFSSTMTIVLFPGPTSSRPRETYEFGREGLFSSSFGFTFTLPGSQTREKFEWETSRGAEVQALQGGHRGMRLVRVQTGEVLVAWAPPSMGSRKKGKLSFLGDRTLLGEQFETMAVITILGLVERQRRNKGARSGAIAGGAGGFAGGGGGGGGGC